MVDQDIEGEAVTDAVEEDISDTKHSSSQTFHICLIVDANCAPS